MQTLRSFLNRLDQNTPVIVHIGDKVLCTSPARMIINGHHSWLLNLNASRRGIDFYIRAKEDA